MLLILIFLYTSVLTPTVQRDRQRADFEFIKLIKNAQRHVIT